MGWNTKRNKIGAAHISSFGEPAENLLASNGLGGSFWKSFTDLSLDDVVLPIAEEVTVPFVAVSIDLSGGGLRLANSDVLNRMPCVGIITRILSGNRGTLENTAGVPVTNPAWVWVAGAQVFISVDGELTQEVPASGVLQPIGIATAIDTVTLNIQGYVIL